MFFEIGDDEFSSFGGFFAGYEFPGIFSHPGQLIDDLSAW